MNPQDLVKSYQRGFEEGKREAMKELQKQNTNTDLPSNETLYKIFDLLFECQDKDRQTCSVYMNAFEHYANYITVNWDKQ